MLLLSSVLPILEGYFHYQMQKRKRIGHHSDIYDLSFDLWRKVTENIQNFKLENNRRFISQVWIYQGWRIRTSLQTLRYQYKTMPLALQCNDNTNLMLVLKEGGKYSHSRHLLMSSSITGEKVVTRHEKCSETSKCTIFYVLNFRNGGRLPIWVLIYSCNLTWTTFTEKCWKINFHGFGWGLKAMGEK